MADDDNNFIRLIFNDIINKPLNEQGQLIDKFLIPKTMDRNKNAEVSTPYKLRQEMLNTIPNEFWTKPNKVFEPCSGKGGFLIDIVNRFMEGLEILIPDKKERYRTIIEECLYFSDINPTNILINKLLLDPDNQYNLNYNEGDTLKLDIKSKWNIDEFDAIISNPPYNYEFDKNGGGASPMYHLFVMKFIDICQYLLFVIPSRWFCGGKGLNNFRKFMLKRKDIKLIRHIEDSQKWFGKVVNIQGGVNYFLKDKNYNGHALLNGINRNLDSYDILPLNSNKLHLIDHANIKIKSNGCLTELYMTRGYYGFQTNDKRFHDKRFHDDTKCWVSTLKSKDRIRYVDNYQFNDDNRHWKVITARINGRGLHDGLGHISIAKPDEVYSSSYIGFKVNNQKEAESLVSYLKTEVINDLICLRKSSHGISKHIFNWVPLPPLDRIWRQIDVVRWLLNGY